MVEVREAWGESLRRGAHTAIRRGCQNLALDRVDNLDRRGARVVGRLIDSPGFGELDPTQQDQIIRLIGSTDPDIGNPAREALRTLLGSEEFRGLSATEQAGRLDDLLREQPGTPWGADSTSEPRAPYTTWSAGGIQPTNHGFGDGTSGGVTSQLTIDGQQIDVIAPTRDGSLPEVDRVVDALASLPPSERARVSRLVIEPQSLADGAWMTASTDGTIRIYPEVTAVPSAAFTDVFTHEAGHLSRSTSSDQTSSIRYSRHPAPPVRSTRVHSGSSGRRRTTPTGSAPRSTRSRTSARTSPRPTVYVSSRGTPRHDQLRSLMPERFAILDQITTPP